MNLEGSKSTQCIYKKHDFIKDDEGLVSKKPVGEDIQIKGILLPISGMENITKYGSEIKYMYKYLIKPNNEIKIGDYIIYDNSYEIIEIERWPKYYTLIIKVII